MSIHLKVVVFCPDVTIEWLPHFTMGNNYLAHICSHIGGLPGCVSYDNCSVKVGAPLVYFTGAHIAPRI